MSKKSIRVTHHALFCSALIVFMFLALIGVNSHAQVKTLAELAKYEGPDRSQVLLDGAKREGELTIYYAHPIVQTIADGFSKMYGIKVKTWRAGSEAIQQRVMAEQKAGKYDLDVLSNTALDTETTYRQKLLQEILSPIQSNLIENALPVHRQWAAFNMDIYSIAYNTRLIGKESLPQKYEDLLSPQWRGQLGIEADDSIWYGALLTELGEVKGKALFEKIMSNNAVSIRKGHSLLAGMVASGEVPLALDVYNWNPEQLKRKGAPIEVAWLSPTLALASAVSILGKAPHPYAALLFYDFALNEGQKYVVDAGYVPTNARFSSTYSNVKYKVIDPSFAANQQEKWQKSYAELLSKRNQ
jgi:iron(III) transport system substrate-binding protein